MDDVRVVAVGPADGFGVRGRGMTARPAVRGPRLEIRVRCATAGTGPGEPAGTGLSRLAGEGRPWLLGRPACLPA
ncbi:MAG TPA: hypothetical protein VGM12_16950 [Trebonia sp.]